MNFIEGKILLMEVEGMAPEITNNYGNKHNSAVFSTAGDGKTEKTKSERIARHEKRRKGMEDQRSHTGDTFERILDPAEMVCGCYPNYNVCTGMPKSIFADRFGYDMQKDIVNHMRDLYAGKISQDEINDYFDECCMAMRKYRTQ